MTKVSEYPLGDPVEASDILYIVQDGVSKRITAEMLASLTPGSVLSGTWVPALRGATTTTYLSQVGSYYKIGKMVFVSGRVTITSIGDGSNNQLGGLPFPSISFPPIAGWLGVTFSSGLAVSPVELHLELDSSVMTARGRTAAAATDVTLGIFQNGASISFSGVYLTP
jgi:hypothetical protein